MTAHFPRLRALGVAWRGVLTREVAISPGFLARVLVPAGNVLLLKNVINLNPDAGEVSQQKLLSLVAERLIDSNSSAQVRSALLLPISLRLFLLFVF